jgi:DNA-binding LytR/AlgR family response regulator
MPITCVIVDDEPLAVKLLESFTQRTKGLELVGSYTDSLEAINAIKQKEPNLLFLDIQMPDLDGMELAHMLPKCTKVIFTTAFKDYAFESYEVSAIDFLLKPIRYNQFINAVDKAKEWFDNKCSHFPNQHIINKHELANNKTTFNTIFIKVDGEYRQVSIDKIVYVCGMKDYVMFYIDGEKRPLVTYLRMKVVEEMLPEDKFMRVNRSYIVALDKIKKVDRNDCIYINEEIIHVTDAFIDNFKNFLQNHKIII